MIAARNKFDLYSQIKPLLLLNKFKVSEYTEIQYGLQFSLSKGPLTGVIRIYESKKGIKLDLSQVKESALIDALKPLLDQYSTVIPATKTKSELSKILDVPDTLIGIDESGKGDYFGPLVIAAVYMNPTIAQKLAHLRIQDSKTLSDEHMLDIAPNIQTLCPHSVIILNNSSYNEVYAKFNNLNHILAWGHARALENVLDQTDCHTALSDQFGDKGLIQTALMTKGQQITLYQFPKAESNIAVAAASILARCEFLKELEKLTQQYQLPFPKGCSDKVIRVAQAFVMKYGAEDLPKVAKMHFKTTQDVLRVFG